MGVLLTIGGNFPRLRAKLTHMVGHLPMVGAFFEVICALAIVGTAVALFPVVKRQNEGVALGYVGLRTLEAGIIAVGVFPLLAVVTLRQHLTGTAGTDTATLVTLGNALV